MLSESELLALTARLLRSTQRAQPIALDRISGGRNNRVYRLTLEDGTSAVVKNYHSDPRDPRDRLASEWNFLNHVWDRQVRATPQPLACEREAHTALYSWISGRRLTQRELEPWHVDAAASFVCKINIGREANALAPASEACFSLAMHIASVDRRIARLATLDPDAPLREAAESLVRDRLLPGWETVRSRTIDQARQAGVDSAQALAMEDRCISPSDFGFHNALVERDHVSFIDFEYAGLDDPAKLVCDFFCQPEVVIPIAHFDRFVDRVMDGLSLHADHRGRFALLLDVYRVKWICIVLNEFLSIDGSRRAFANPQLRERQCETQLAKAGLLLAQIETA